MINVLCVVLWRLWVNRGNGWMFDFGLVSGVQVP